MAVLVGLVSAVLPWSGPAQAETVTAGICWLEVSTGVHGLVPPPSATEVDIVGTGDCLAIGSAGPEGDNVYTGELVATVNSLHPGTVGCFTGVATGSGTFTLTRTEFPDDRAMTVAVVAAGALAVAGLPDDDGVLTGAGVFLPRTGPAQSCVPGPTAMTWKGPFVFGQATLMAASGAAG